MARTLHFDCFSGISGDMTLAALLDLGVPEQTIQDALGSLGLPGQLVVSRIKKAGMAATYIKVETPHEHKHRHLKHINEIIDKGRLTEGAKRIAKEMFLKLAEAEAAVHAGHESLEGGRHVAPPRAICSGSLHVKKKLYATKSPAVPAPARIQRVWFFWIDVSAAMYPCARAATQQMNMTDASTAYDQTAARRFASAWARCSSDAESCR